MQISNRVQLILGAVLVYLIQIHLVTVESVNDYVKYVSPFLIIGIFIVIAQIYFGSIQQYNFSEKRINRAYGILGALIGLLSIGLCYEELRLIFKMYPEPRKHSDVIPQLEALYDRFSKGEYPYTPAQLSTHKPFPVYLPSNWFPIAITHYFDIDTRWIGIIFLALSTAMYGWYIFKRDTNIWLKGLLVFLPSIAIWATIISKAVHIPVTLETLIAAYYLILAVGLLSKNLPITIAGVILCLLSRYTLVFWLPMFAYLLWVNKGKKLSMITWSTVGLVCITVMTVFFYQHPKSFLEGLNYHNACAIAGMEGYGIPNVSLTHEAGLYFAPHFKSLLPFDAHAKVTILRGLQATIMILLNVVGIMKYNRVKGKVDFYKYSLGFLYLFLVYFYMFSPLTYRYYFLTLSVLSAVLISEVCIIVFNKKIVKQ